MATLSTETCGAIQTQAPARPLTLPAAALYLVLGIAFGVTLTQSEVLSWYRIQEMFRFQSPRMYLIIASALATAALSLQILQRAGVTSLDGDRIEVTAAETGSPIRYAAGGTLFGIGWALTGACPGPLFALAGNGLTVMLAAIAAALAGTWTYGKLRPYIPH
jgi:uncharacterized protein